MNNLNYKLETLISISENIIVLASSMHEVRKLNLKLSRAEATPESGVRQERERTLETQHLFIRLQSSEKRLFPILTRDARGIHGIGSNRRYFANFIKRTQSATAIINRNVAAVAF